jgi:hypothetical protein
MTFKQRLSAAHYQVGKVLDADLDLAGIDIARNIRWKVGGCADCLDTGHGLGLRGVDRQDAGMCMGTSHYFREERPLRGEIGTEHGLAGHFIGAIYLPVSLPKLFEFNTVCISTKFSRHSNSRSK